MTNKKVMIFYVVNFFFDSKIGKKLTRNRLFLAFVLKTSLPNSTKKLFMWIKLGNFT